MKTAFFGEDANWGRILCALGGRGAHALDESADTTDSWMGTQPALLLTIALAQN